MLKKNKFLLPFCFLLFFLFSNFCFAASLEVTYPAPPRGTGISYGVTLPAYLKYVFDIAMFFGFVAVVVSLAVAGVYYFLSAAAPSMRAKANEQIYGAFSGLFILLLAYLIITTINPSLSFFKTTILSTTPTVPPPPPLSGVFIYKNPGCSSPDPSPMTGGLPSFENNLSNRIQSVKTVNSPADDIYYYSILYESPKYRGKCLFINPFTNCDRGIDPFASSISVDKYSREAIGDIVFYRNSAFTKDGGTFTVKGSEVQNKIYNGDMENLKFIDPSAKSNDNPDGCTVPKTQQDCIKWKEDGTTCEKRQCPFLAGNIGSIEIKGNYRVVVVYFDQKDNPKGPWSFCQAFPTPDDINNYGSLRIKWEDISNNKVGRLPNYFIIIPIQKN